MTSAAKAKGNQAEASPSHPRKLAAMNRVALCQWCGKSGQESEWEQRTLSGKWSRLCKPLNSLLAMRKVEKETPS